MKKYAVWIPISGYIYTEVEADSEEDAKEAAFSNDLTFDDIEEWDTHESIVTGNVFHGSLNDIEIEEIEEIEE